MCELARDPEIPSGLYNRTADNWRVLLAIADDLGHGKAARAFAIELNSDRPDEDAAVTGEGDICAPAECLARQARFFRCHSATHITFKYQSKAQGRGFAQNEAVNCCDNIGECNEQENGQDGSRLH